MIVAGTAEEAFLSHIPLFKAPHDVQLVVAGSFVPDAPGGSVPPSFSDSLFTFVPDRCSLDALRTGTLQPGELRGTLFLGNFEAGGRPLPARVRFVVSRVLYQQLLDAKSSQPELTYLLFGSAGRTFAAHRVSGSPGFDEIVRVELAGDVPPAADLARGVEARLASKDELASRLGLSAAPREARADRRTFTVKPAGVLSCLEGPGFDAPCR
jgi:hypothetical protein